MAKQPKPKSFIPSKDEFQDLVDRANYGDADARVELQQFLDQHPEIWRVGGDLNLNIQDDFIKQISKGDVLLAECIGRKLAERRKALLRNPQSPVEQVTVERVLTCELEIQFLASKYPDTPELSKDRGSEVLRCKESAEKRLRTALKSLAAVQKFIPRPRPKIKPRAK